MDSFTSIILILIFPILTTATDNATNSTNATTPNTDQLRRVKICPTNLCQPGFRCVQRDKPSQIMSYTCISNQKPENANLTHTDTSNKTAISNPNSTGNLTNTSQVQQVSTSTPSSIPETQTQNISTKILSENSTIPIVVNATDLDSKNLTLDKRATDKPNLPMVNETLPTAGNLNLPHNLTTTDQDKKLASNSSVSSGENPPVQPLNSNSTDLNNKNLTLVPLNNGTGTGNGTTIKPDLPGNLSLHANFTGLSQNPQSLTNNLTSPNSTVQSIGPLILTENTTNIASNSSNQSNPQILENLNTTNGNLSLSQIPLHSNSNLTSTPIQVILPPPVPSPAGLISNANSTLNTPLNATLPQNLPIMVNGGEMISNATTATANSTGIKNATPDPVKTTTAVISSDEKKNSSGKISCSKDTCDSKSKCMQISASHIKCVPL